MRAHLTRGARRFDSGRRRDPSLRASRLEALDYLRADALAQAATAQVSVTEVNPAVDAREAGLVRRRAKRIEAPNGLADRQPGAVVERAISQHRRQHLGCRGRDGRMPRGILGKRRRRNEWLPRRVDHTTDVRARANQIVLVLVAPRRYEG